jgi:hypothetical protein
MIRPYLESMTGIWYVESLRMRSNVDNTFKVMKQVSNWHVTTTINPRALCRIDDPLLILSKYQRYVIPKMPSNLDNSSITG